MATVVESDVKDTNTAGAYFEENEEGLDPEHADIPEGVTKIIDLLYNTQVYESPIDVHVPNTVAINLPPLKWNHMELVPKKTKFTNTGHTVIFSAKWFQERPFICDGPLLGNYVFSQLHFHWGANNMEGSEHTISGVPHPLEMHVVFFKSCYLTQESALKKKDGIAVIVYIFKDESNPAIGILTESIPNITKAHSSYRLKSYPLEKFMKSFENDYFLYAGSVNTSSCLHYILWIISREPIGISHVQIDVFRSLLDTNDEPLNRNFRQVQPLSNRIVYHANPSGFLHDTLLILQKEFDAKITQRPQQVNKYPRSSKEYTGQTIYRADTILSNPFAKPGVLRDRMSGDERAHDTKIDKKSYDCCEHGQKRGDNRGDKHDCHDNHVDLRDNSVDRHDTFIDKRETYAYKRETFVDRYVNRGDKHDNHVDHVDQISRIDEKHDKYETFVTCIDGHDNDIDRPDIYVTQNEKRQARQLIKLKETDDGIGEIVKETCAPRKLIINVDPKIKELLRKRRQQM